MKKLLSVTVLLAFQTVICAQQKTENSNADYKHPQLKSPESTAYMAEPQTVNTEIVYSSPSYKDQRNNAGKVIIKNKDILIPRQSQPYTRPSGDYKHPNGL